MQRDAQVIHRVPCSRRGWELSEEQMTESDAHHATVELLKAILSWWARERENVQVARNMAVRWDEDEPRVGTDPDVAVLSPRPPREDGVLSSVRTWLPGHAPPLLAVEVVSDSNPRKDYAIAPDKYAASGTRELWVFDPRLAGPSTHGGPFRLQLWHRDEQGSFVRAYAGDGPVRSDVLGAYAVVVEGGARLRVADDPEGRRLWPTEAEAERAARQAERAARDAERAAKDAALARSAELEAELRRR
jgi:hypothetical protein